MLFVFICFKVYVPYAQYCAPNTTQGKAYEPILALYEGNPLALATTPCTKVRRVQTSRTARHTQLAVSAVSAVSHATHRPLLLSPPLLSQHTGNP